MGLIGIIKFLGLLLFAIVLLSICGYVGYDVYKDIRSYQIISEECEGTNLCFCDNLECVVKFSCSTSSINNIQTSDDCTDKNKKLCEIANKAKYKKMIFEYCN